MPSTVRAAVCRAFGQPLSIEHIELDDPGPDEVRVRLEAVAICHSDISFADGAWGGGLPMVLGHEAVGRDVDTGERVVVTLIRSCGTCAACERGHTVGCTGRFDEHAPIRSPDGSPIEQGMLCGAFAEEVVVHRSQTTAIDDAMPATAAALLACGVITGVGAVRNSADVEPGSTVVVLGIGGVGLNVVQGARLAGAARIVAVDLHPDKLALANALGATHTVHLGEQSPADAVAALTDGAMAEYVFVATGAPAALDSAIGLAGAFGSVVIVGMPAAGVTGTYDPASLAAASQRIIGSKMGASVIDRDIPDLAERYRSGTLELDRLVSGTFRLDDINAAMDEVRSGAALRNVIVFDGG